MNVLVTGSTGNVGARIAAKLVARGDRVRALVRDPARARPMLPAEVELVAGDVTLPDTLTPAMHDVELVFHAAGVVEQWVADETIFDRVNHRGTQAVFDAAREAGVRRLVHTSTMDVFAAPRGGTLVETSLDRTPKPSAYERSKVAADRVFARATAAGFDAVSVNPAAVYGPSPTSVALNAAITNLVNGRVPLLPPGGVSLVYVDGVVDAHLAAAERGRAGERYLVTDGFLTLREIAETIARLRGGTMRIPPDGPEWLLRFAAAMAPAARLFGVELPISAGELEYVLWQPRIDDTKARRELGFTPLAIEEGMRRTLEHLVATGAIPPA